MEDLASKVDGDEINGAEWRQQPKEIQNVITDSGQALNGGDLRQLAKATPIVVSSKAIANAIPIIEDGRKVFITSPDGGIFTMRTGLPVGTLNDDGGTLSGTKFTPGDGSTGFERDYEGMSFSGWFQGGEASANVMFYSAGVESFRSAPGGINFSANNSAANTLDDYEEGTWTADFIASTSGTITMDPSFRTGRYTKVGREVSVILHARHSAINSPVGELSITGLPFTSGASNQIRVAGSIFLNPTSAPAGASIVCYITNNQNAISVRGFDQIGLAATGYIQVGTETYLEITYITD